MKNLKTLIAALVITFAASAASAQPVHAQRGLENAELHKRKEKARAEREKKEKKVKDEKGDKAKKARPEKVEHGKQDKLDRVRPERPKYDKPTALPINTENAEKRSERSAKGLDRGDKELRKHLLRTAKIERIAQIARSQSNDRLLQRAEALRFKENTRHERALQRLQTADAPDVGAP